MSLLALPQLILVTAATGQAGREALADLVRRGANVRALARDVSRVGPERAPFVLGSYENDAALARASGGVDVLFVADRDSPDAVARHKRVLEHTREAGVQHVAKLSALGASPISPVGLMRDHHEVDEESRRGPWSWTLLWPDLYLQNLLHAAEAVGARGGSRHRWETAVASNTNSAPTGGSTP
jgi:uncharacterized protein YbjT (DUF2867 family)